MLIDILSTDNYISFNTKIANILGLHEAIYISELININNKAIRKNKVEDNFILIDRDYITSRTTLSIDEQEKIDQELQDLNILKRDKDNNTQISLDFQILSSFLNIEDAATLSKIKATLKTKQPKATKRQAIANNLKQYIVAENEELKEAYFDWIEGVYSNPNGFLSRKSILLFQETIDNYCNHNLDLALTLINIATINGYRDATWAINNYVSNNKITYKIPIAQNIKHEEQDKPELSEEVF